MGYYITGEGYITILDEDLAYRALCDLNDRDDLKLGGGWRLGENGERIETKHFSWMSPDYPDKCDNSQEILEMLGFEFAPEDDRVYYDSKTGQEHLFLEALAPYADFEIYWIGEEHEEWRTRSIAGHLFWEEAYQAFEDLSPL